MTNYGFRNVSFIALLVFLSGCITTIALYGNTFEPQGNDVYTLKVMYGGNEVRTEQIDKKARKAVIKEAEKFVAEKEEYQSFEILDFERVLVPSHLKYRVQFSGQ